MKSCLLSTGVSSPTSLSARRVWIEIYVGKEKYVNLKSHSLRGECGLKYPGGEGYVGIRASLSARRVWIEMGTFEFDITLDRSLSARRVWIEILNTALIILPPPVTLCEESVD